MRNRSLSRDESSHPPLFCKRVSKPLWRRLGSGHAGHGSHCCHSCYPGAIATRAGGRRVPDHVVDIILEPGASDLHLLQFLIRSKVDFLLDPINSVIEPMVFVEHGPEVVIAALQAANDITMLRELSHNGMMKVHMV